MKVATRRLLEEQIAVVVVLESGKKDDAMWHVPHKHMRHGKLKKHNSEKQPTVDCTLEPIQRSGVKHSVRKVITQSNLSRQVET